MKILTREDLHDILLGAALVGTGGGGSLEEGIEIIDKALDDGCQFLLAEWNDINDDELVVTPYGCGSISPFTKEQQKKYDSLPKIKARPEVVAVNSLEDYLGAEIQGIVATELGGFNTAVALNAAARLNKPIVDGDPAGRSVPCLQHSTYYLNDINIAPMSIANIFGDKLILTDVVNDERAEALVRSAAVASFNLVGVVDHVAEWKIIKDVLIKNTITMCLNIGKTARKARNNNKNIAYAIADEFNGYVIFEGVVREANWEDKNGFTFGNIYIDGKDKFEGSNMRIWFQNEHIVSWKDEKVYITVPDSINIVSNDENMPLLNPNARVGQSVTVFAFKSFDKWRTKKGIEVFGPKFFGFDIEYKKIEDIFEQ